MVDFIMPHILDYFIFVGPSGSNECRLALLNKFLAVSEHLNIPIKHSKTALPTTLATVHYKHIPISFVITPQPNKSCPFTNISLYLSLIGLTPGPLLCFPGGNPVSRSAFMSRFNKNLNLIGLDSKFYEGHSFRIGKATELALSGIPDHEIQARSRWHQLYQIHKNSKHLVVDAGQSISYQRC